LTSIFFAVERLNKRTDADFKGRECLHIKPGPHQAKRTLSSKIAPERRRPGMPIGKTEARYRTESFCSNFLDSSGVKTSFALPGASVPQPPAKARAE
jgi:hypothetical protein